MLSRVEQVVFVFQNTGQREGMDCFKFEILSDAEGMQICISELNVETGIFGMESPGISRNLQI